MRTLCGTHAEDPGEYTAAELAFPLEQAVSCATSDGVTHAKSSQEKNSKKVQRELSNYGFHTTWQTRTVRFRGISANIELPEGARYMDLGCIAKKNMGYDAQGMSTLHFIEGKPSVLISREAGIRYEERIFVRGHEEGHSLVYLARAEQLYKELEEEGFSFSFFTREMAKELDHVHSRVHKQQQDLLGQYWSIHMMESLADLGGLLAVRRHLHMDLLENRIAEHIKNHYTRGWLEQPFPEENELNEIRERWETSDPLDNLNHEELVELYGEPNQENNI